MTQAESSESFTSFPHGLERMGHDESDGTRIVEGGTRKAVKTFFGDQSLDEFQIVAAEFRERSAIDFDHHVHGALSFQSADAGNVGQLRTYELDVLAEDVTSVLEELRRRIG